MSRLVSRLVCQIVDIIYEYIDQNINNLLGQRVLLAKVLVILLAIGKFILAPGLKAAEAKEKAKEPKSAFG